MKSASGSFLWDGTNLDVTGRIFAQAGGTIAGWNIGTDYISKNGVYLSSVTDNRGIYVKDSSNITRIQLGEFPTKALTELNSFSYAGGTTFDSYINFSSATGTGGGSSFEFDIDMFTTSD